MRQRRTTLRFLAFGLGVAALGCDTSVPTLPAPPTRLVVHGVLEPFAPSQFILLQESRAFRSGPPPANFDPEEPILSWGEVPVSNARVVLYAANGDSAVAVEDRTIAPSGKGAGVYRIFSGASVIPPGGAAAALPGIYQGQRYRLRITSKFGVAEGSTIIPQSSGSFEGGNRAIDPTRDSLRMRPRQVAAAGYLYRDEVGEELRTFNDRFRRDLEQRLIRPSAEDDWAFAFARDLFVVGSHHVLSVTAVDANYFDYYSTVFDPFASRSDQTSLEGAVGLFGSALPLYVMGVQIVRR